MGTKEFEFQIVVKLKIVKTNFGNWDKINDLDPA